MILALRTDKPEAELYLYSQQGQLIDSYSWLAHRELSDTILQKIDELLVTSNVSLSELKGIIVYKGPGSFTGLRIGLSVANTLAYSLEIPIVGSTGEQWQFTGVNSLQINKDDRVIIPEYGSDAHITAPRK